ncbi:hypothetical protein ACQ86G_03855 [Roseateles chitinivorans]|uniref:hypothetical protein n=1 Tax=Roseateles chitinivorans TaxID=2917965 RepID=UPI003D66F261
MEFMMFFRRKTPVTKTPIPRELLNACLYLDRAYIAELYEVLTGEDPATTITRNQSKKAGASIPAFSAEISAQETRAYKVSSTRMLARVLPDLKQEPALQSTTFSSGMPSQFGWFEGELTVFKARSGPIDQDTGKMKVEAEGDYFHVRQKGCPSIALITTPDYFNHDLDALLRMQDTVLKEMSLPVRAYLRVLAATSHDSQWVGVPLLILERSTPT